MADLDDQQTVGLEMLLRAGEDRARQIEAIFTAGQRQFGFPPVLVGQGGHRTRLDVGGVGDDQVVAALLEAGKEISLDESNARRQVVVFNVVPGHREGVRRNIDGVDPGGGEGVRRDDGQACRAGAQVENGADCLGIVDPWRQLLAQQLGNEGTRHDHPLIDVETVLAEPGFVGQVGDRQAFADAAFDDPQEAGALVAGEPRVEEGLESIERQVQGVQQQIRGFVPGVVGTVTEEQLRLVEAADGKAQQVAQCREFGLRLVKHWRAAIARGSADRWRPVAAGRPCRRIR